VGFRDHERIEPVSRERCVCAAENSREDVVQSSLIYLLIFFVVLALQGYYFGFVRPPVVLAWLQQATFVIATFLMIPILVYVLVSQSGAIGRLENTGIRPYPGITESVGVGNGVGDHPTWIFEVQASSGDVRKFYSSAENTGDWSFHGDDGIFLRFRKGDLEMKIAHRDSWSSDTLIYMLEEY
jgi:hypothetical protein